MEYFVRYTDNPEVDLERGYSFDSYAIFQNPNDVAEHFGLDYFEIADYGDNPEYYAARNVVAIAPADSKGTLWGIMLNGLAGFGPFDTVEEAEAFAKKGKGLYGLEVYPQAVIYEGRDEADYRCFEGTTFHPKRIVKIIRKE